MEPLFDIVNRYHVERLAPSAFLDQGVGRNHQCDCGQPVDFITGRCEVDDA